MKLDYGTQISPHPIKMQIGTVRKPTLNDIAELTFSRFDMYEALVRLTPEDLLSQYKNGDKTIWELLPEEDKNSITLYDLVISNEELANEYVNVLQFFFIEKIVFYCGEIILLKCDIKENVYYSEDEILGKIGKNFFLEVINVIQQICCINDKEDESEMKFKNAKARRLFEKMKKSKKAEKKVDSNYTIPNIISSVAAMHNSINIVNIWDLTIFQLLDQFSRLTANAIYSIEQTRVSVWGDEKKTFDAALWYKNEFDKK